MRWVVQSYDLNSWHGDLHGTTLVTQSALRDLAHHTARPTHAKSEQYLREPFKVSATSTALSESLYLISESCCLVRPVPASQVLKRSCSEVYVKD